MHPTDHHALAHHAAELASAWAHARMTGECVLTPEFIRYTVLPSVHLLRRSGWHLANAQTVENMAVLTQAAVRLDRHPIMDPTVAALC